MKNLVAHSLNAIDYRKEWQEFETLLKSNPVLDERKDILPFFKKCHNLSILICTYFPQIRNPNKFAHEYGIYQGNRIKRNREKVREYRFLSR